MLIPSHYVHAHAIHFAADDLSHQFNVNNQAVSQWVGAAPSLSLALSLSLSPLEGEQEVHLRVGTFHLPQNLTWLLCNWVMHHQSCLQKTWIVLWHFHKGSCSAKYAAQMFHVVHNSLCWCFLTDLKSLIGWLITRGPHHQRAGWKIETQKN